MEAKLKPELASYYELALAGSWWTAVRSLSGSPTCGFSSFMAHFRFVVCSDRITSSHMRWPNIRKFRQSPSAGSRLNSCPSSGVSESRKENKIPAAFPHRATRIRTLRDKSDWQITARCLLLLLLFVIRSKEDDPDRSLICSAVISNKCYFVTDFLCAWLECSFLRCYKNFTP
jgi:hypothetical protein